MIAAFIQLAGLAPLYALAVFAMFGNLDRTMVPPWSILGILALFWTLLLLWFAALVDMIALGREGVLRRILLHSVPGLALVLMPPAMWILMISAISGGI